MKVEENTNAKVVKSSHSSGRPVRPPDPELTRYSWTAGSTGLTDDDRNEL